MKRLYYVAKTLEEADTLHAALREAGIGETRYHVVSRDDVGIYKHHFHPSTPLLTNDMIRQSERGLLLGIPAGLLAAAIITGVFNYFRDHLLLTFVIVTAVVAAHGMWMGGMVGLALPSSRLRRFKADIDAGHYLFVVDVDRAHYATVKQRMRALKDRLPLRGEDSTLVTPFG
jgi:hypothetical protein